MGGASSYGKSTPQKGDLRNPREAGYHLPFHPPVNGIQSL